MKNFLWALLLIISYSTNAFAQDNYYYYLGKKIPLTLNKSKVCVSIPKRNSDTYGVAAFSNESETNRITDDNFDIFIVEQSKMDSISLYNSEKQYSETIFCSPCFLTTNNNDVYLSPYINIRLKKEEDIELLKTYAEKYKLRIVRNDPLMPLWYILSLSQECAKNSLECANEIWESGDFAASIPDLCSNDLVCSDDPMYYLQWGLHNNEYPDIDISASKAWQYATGKNVKIAILDTGVDLNHKDLVPNISTISYDTETNSSPSVVYGVHGTHCAGIAAAAKDNGIQIAGVAPNATIISVSNSLKANTNSQLKRADGIIWAYKNGADIISNSWKSGTVHSAIDEAIEAALNKGRKGKGCIIVFAAGNDGANEVNYPANCNDKILAVGSIDKSGHKAKSSNYGDRLDIVAPGDQIYSTLPNNTAGYYSGTSMACPHVSGVAALILEKCPELTVDQVNHIIKSSTKKLPNVTFDEKKTDGTWNNMYGYGLVDAYNAVVNTPNVTYIQNEAITGTRTVSANRIYVGRNVTENKSEGNVILGPGNVTLKADYVEIKNSTSVPLGTTLRINNKTK